MPSAPTCASQARPGSSGPRTSRTKDDSFSRAREPLVAPRGELAPTYEGQEIDSTDTCTPGRSWSQLVRSRLSRSAKSLLEPRVVAYGGEVIISARVLAEPREQLDGPPEVGERIVAGFARERCEARVVVMQARVVGHLLEGSPDRFDRVGVALFAVGLHGLVMERPRLTPVDPLVRLAGCGADGKDGSVPGRLPP